MLLLATVLGRPTDNNTLRSYQRDRWGANDGESCVIELSGLAAPNLGVLRDRVSFREERIGIIRDRIGQFKPKVVVMYGTRDLPAWEVIGGGTAFPSGEHPEDRADRAGCDASPCESRNDK